MLAKPTGDGFILLMSDEEAAEIFNIVNRLLSTSVPGTKGLLRFHRTLRTAIHMKE